MAPRELQQRGRYLRACKRREENRRGQGHWQDQVNKGEIAWQCQMKLMASVPYTSHDKREKSLSTPCSGLALLNLLSALRGSRTVNIIRLRVRAIFEQPTVPDINPSSHFDSNTRVPHCDDVAFTSRRSKSSPTLIYSYSKTDALLRLS